MELKDTVNFPWTLWNPFIFCWHVLVGGGDNLNGLEVGRIYDMTEPSMKNGSSPPLTCIWDTLAGCEVQVQAQKRKPEFSQCQDKASQTVVNLAAVLGHFNTLSSSCSPRSSPPRQRTLTQQAHEESRENKYEASSFYTVNNNSKTSVPDEAVRCWERESLAKDKKCFRTWPEAHFPYSSSES